MVDLFISHASEDKEELVRPLANKLKEFGVNIWYDEFSIQSGDSISASIDRGLIECNYGLLILSPSFLKKKWTDYELKGLLTKEVNKGKTIIPIWHKVDYETVSNRSLYLADKKSLDSSIGIDSLVIEIIKIVRPDIINSFALKSIGRELIRRSNTTIKKPISELREGKTVHKTIPNHIIFASKIIESVFPDAVNYTELVKSFAKDFDYDREFVIWCAISSAYLNVIYEINSLPTKDYMKKMFEYLIMFSMDNNVKFEENDLPDNIKQLLEIRYLFNLKELRNYL